MAKGLGRGKDMRAEDFFDLLQQIGGDPGHAAERLIKELMSQYGRGLHQMVDKLCGTKHYAEGAQSDNAYAILGLERTASDEEVKHRYREILMKIHPDTAGVKGTGFLTQMVVEAYHQISRERGWCN
jgi:DnaJ-domain-containing protein 1